MTLLVDLGVESLDVQGTCTPACRDYVLRWLRWGARQGFFANGTPGAPCALLVVPDTFDAYLELIGAKSRNMLRKAERADYTYRPFVYNDHLAAIHQINLSKPVRSGGPMRPEYREAPKPMRGQESGCQAHHKVWLGAFRSGRLRAYCALAVVRELAVIVSILGHGDALSDGVMNGLLAEVVRYAQSAHVKAVNYLTLGGPEGLARFKRSVGFHTDTLLLA